MPKKVPPKPAPRPVTKPGSKVITPGPMKGGSFAPIEAKEKGEPKVHLMPFKKKGK